MGSKEIITLMRLLEMSESQCTVGTFSFSNGLESASNINLIANASTLQQYVMAVSRQVAYSDSIASIQAYRAAADDDYDCILQADEEVIACKTNPESKEFTKRLGKKLAEESLCLMDCPMIERFLNDLINDITPGTYPIAQAILLYHTGVSEMEMFCSQQFGVINLILAAALKSVKVPGFDTQKIAYNLAPQAALDYKIIKHLDFSDMKAFIPYTELNASFHRTGSMMMAMN
ncbi:MAG: hypothetical protein NC421_07720 [Lachnospiraceae bacterium]|nr:hypothetical protein [Lachnospiraceae bacterium]